VEVVVHTVNVVAVVLWGVATLEFSEVSLRKRPLLRSRAVVEVEHHQRVAELVVD
jgi:hypothetical protein